MKRAIAIIATLALLATTAFAAEQSFNGVKVTDAKGKQTDARLAFDDEAKKVSIYVAGRDFLVIPYENVDKVSYEYTKKHRITQGAVVMVASIGAGAIVMLTKSKSHWLYIDFHEQNATKSVVLRMDKNQYENIISAVSLHTGKAVSGFEDEKGSKTSEPARASVTPEQKPATNGTAAPAAQPEGLVERK